MNVLFSRFPLVPLVALAGALSSCAPFPVPADWPVSLKEDRAKVALLQGVVATSAEPSVLTRQERALLTFLADNNRVNEAIGKSGRHGEERNWRIAEIFLVEPGSKVSVLCEEGHFQEPLYFRYNPDNAVWYRVEDFENTKAAAIAALIVQQESGGQRRR